MLGSQDLLLDEHSDQTTAPTLGKVFKHTEVVDDLDEHSGEADSHSVHAAPAQSLSDDNAESVPISKPKERSSRRSLILESDESDDEAPKERLPSPNPSADTETTSSDAADVNASISTSEVNAADSSTAKTKSVLDSSSDEEDAALSSKSEGAKRRDRKPSVADSASSDEEGEGKAGKGGRRKRASLVSDTESSEDERIAREISSPGVCKPAVA